MSSMHLVESIRNHGVYALLLAAGNFKRKMKLVLLPSFLCGMLIGLKVFIVI